MKKAKRMTFVYYGNDVSVMRNVEIPALLTQIKHANKYQPFKHLHIHDAYCVAS